MKLNKEELESVLTVGFIISIRLLGIFLILPVFSVYSIQYPGSSLTLAGIAFGIYALIQSILQIPFGWASDRIGRKPVLLFGLFLFSIGSFYCGIADDINQLIIARIIQGSGAIGSVALASLGDVTRPGVRAQAFTITGMIIGAAFLIAIVFGPLIASEFSFSTLFYVLTLLGLIAILVTLLFFPKIKLNVTNDKAITYRSLIQNINLRKLFISAGILSLLLNVFIFIYPLSWENLGINESKLWKVYFIVLIPSALLVFPYIRYAERKKILDGPSRWGWYFLIISFVLYLIGFNYKFILYSSGIMLFLGSILYQSIFPAFLTQRIPSEQRGASTGVYNLSNFLGASIGGMASGFLYQNWKVLPIIFCIAVLILWKFVGIPHPPDSEKVRY